MNLPLSSSGLIATPPAAAMAMPTQALAVQPNQRVAAPISRPRLARIITFGGSLMLTVAASYQMQLLLPLTTTKAAPLGLDTPFFFTLLWLLLALFTLTFSWGSDHGYGRDSRISQWQRSNCG